MTESEDLMEKLDKEARAGGYLLNPDRTDTLTLCEGLLVNTKRYGYQSCPCRIAEGKRDADRDIICPCDYRDPDLNDWGACYCALYVTKEWIDGKTDRKVVPERRPTKAERERAAGNGQRAVVGQQAMVGQQAEGIGQEAGFRENAWAIPAQGASAQLSAGTTAGPVLKGKYPVWRCKVCGYLCARDEPPNVCPICKVTKDRFERFM